MATTVAGEKAKIIDNHLEFVAATKQILQEGFSIGVHDVILSGSQVRREVILSGHIISYGGDLVDLSAIMKVMGAASPNCRLPFHNISAVSVTARNRHFSAVYGLENFRFKTDAETVTMCQSVEQLKTTGEKNYAEGCSTFGTMYVI